MLTVVSVAYPLAAVTPATAGGAEQILLQIDAALVEAGHRSIVVAPAGSTVSGELLAIPQFEPERAEEAHREIQRVLQSFVRHERVDVIHLHGVDFPHYIPEGPVAVLATLHLPPELYPQTVFGDGRVVLHCVSESQQERCPAASNLLPCIRNGVNAEFYRPARRKRGYAIALGRICPEKGLHHAIDAARIAGLPLILAGELFHYAAHVEYFRREIEPRKPKFIGPAGPERKRRLLAGAQCVLVPSVVPETSSLVAMEAQACGTPVIAFPSGALPTIVRDGETGFLVQDTAAMADAIPRTSHLDPQVCRDHAVRHFDIRRTAAAYIDTYRKLATEWADLWEQCLDAPPFLHPAWQDSWWESFGSGSRITFRVRRGGELVALGTFYSHDNRLVFAGNGISDRLGVLAVDDDAAQELISQIRRYPLDLQEIPDGSPLLVLPNEPCSECPVASLDQPIPAKLRRHLAQQRRYLGAHRFTTSSEPELVNTLVELHEKRWRSRGCRGVLAEPQTRRFHELCAPRLSRAGLLRFHTLEVQGGTVIGILYGLVARDRMLFYLNGFDPAYERFSPGSLLIEYAMEQARKSGQRLFDFLRGAEAYKYRWGARDCIHYRIRC